MASSACVDGSFGLFWLHFVAQPWSALPCTAISHPSRINSSFGLLLALWLVAVSAWINGFVCLCRWLFWPVVFGLAFCLLSHGLPFPAQPSHTLNRIHFSPHSAFRLIFALMACRFGFSVSLADVPVLDTCLSLLKK